jgi:hypothetical protein
MDWGGRNKRRIDVNVTTLRALAGYKQGDEKLKDLGS